MGESTAGLLALWNGSLSGVDRAVKPPGSPPGPFQGGLVRSAARSNTQGGEPVTGTAEAGRVQIPPELQAFTPRWPTERRNYWPILLASRGKATVFKLVFFPFDVGLLSLEAD